MEPSPGLLSHSARAGALKQQLQVMERMEIGRGLQRAAMRLMPKRLTGLQEDRSSP